MFYYKEIAKRIGHAARYQFYAEFLTKTKVAALEQTTFAIRTKLGSLRVFSFFAPARKVLPISFVNHRDLRDPTAAPSYQRLIQKSRLRQIAEFLNEGGFFPNSIILNFKQRVRFDPIKPENEDGVTPGTLTLPNTYKSAWIIDGQHRIYGYAELEEKKSALLPFIAFENISITEETKLFSEINSKQKRVEKRLLDELTGEIKLESADRREQIRAIASRAFDIMREDDDGPLGGKITGVELKQSDQSVLTIPYLVDAVSQAGLLGRVVSKEGKNVYMQGPLHWDQPREAINATVQFLTEYLLLFRNTNLERWEAGKAGRIATNPGVAGTIRLASDLIAMMEKRDKEDPRHLHPKTLVERLEPYAQPCLEYIKIAADAELEKRFSIPFGSGGPRIFQHRLRELVFHQFDDFDPFGFKDDLRRYDAERTQRGDKMVRAIQRDVHGHIISKLKEVYGGDDKYLERSIDNKELLKKAYEKRIEADESDRKDQGTYFDFLDLRKIIESPKNWDHFKDELDIILKDDKKKSKNVYWFDVINRTRRVPAHPYNRSYSDEDYGALDFVYRKLIERGIILNDDE
jgi:DGQHR domain-containing protein